MKHQKNSSNPKTFPRLGSKSVVFHILLVIQSYGSADFHPDTSDSVVLGGFPAKLTEMNFRLLRCRSFFAVWFQ